jgi:hypothetical protein
LWDAIVSLSSTPTLINRHLPNIEIHCLSEPIGGVS